MIYYTMILHPFENTILGVKEGTTWEEPRPISGGRIATASFSSSESSGADVVTPAGKPEILGSYDTETKVYVVPEKPFQYELVSSISGDVTDNNGVWEISPDGSKTIVVTLQKYNTSTNVKVDGSDSYYVSVSGLDLKPNAGKVTLVNGEATLTMQPPSGILGLGTIRFQPINHDIIMRSNIFIAAV